MPFKLIYDLWANRCRHYASANAAHPASFPANIQPLELHQVTDRETVPNSMQALIDVQQVKDQFGTRGVAAGEQGQAWIAPKWMESVLLKGMPKNVRSLFHDAKKVDVERRKRTRIPFTTPVVINGIEGRLSAVTRDISSVGISFIHGGQLEPQIVQVEAKSMSNEPIELTVEILWCTGWGAGWYFSGGVFRNV